MDDEVTELRKALAACLIPLEVLNMDNYMGARWMTDEVKDAVASAVTVGRTAIMNSAPKG